jgi:hypothetical protein
VGTHATALPHGIVGAGAVVGAIRTERVMDSRPIAVVNTNRTNTTRINHLFIGTPSE